MIKIGGKLCPYMGAEGRWGLFWKTRDFENERLSPSRFSAGRGGNYKMCNVVIFVAKLNTNSILSKIC